MEDYKAENGGTSIIMMTEAYTDTHLAIRFYGDGVRNGSHIPVRIFIKLNHKYTKNYLISLVQLRHD